VSFYRTEVITWPACLFLACLGVALVFPQFGLTLPEPCKSGSG
jgi:hypothetical protein